MLDFAGVPKFKVNKIMLGYMKKYLKYLTESCVIVVLAPNSVFIPKAVHMLFIK